MLAGHAPASCHRQRTVGMRAFTGRASGCTIERPGRLLITAGRRTPKEHGKVAPTVSNSPMQGSCLRKHRTPHPERSVRSYARQGAPSGLPSTLLLEGLVTGVTRWSRAVQAVRLLFVSRLVDASMTARPPLPRFAFLGAAKLVFIVEWIAENSEDMQKNEPAYRAKEYGHHGGRWQ